jgi:hypothetical protein
MKGRVDVGLSGRRGVKVKVEKVQGPSKQSVSN